MEQLAAVFPNLADRTKEERRWNALWNAKQKARNFNFPKVETRWYLQTHEKKKEGGGKRGATVDVSTAKL